jgi:hypothetical protein
MTDDFFDDEILAAGEGSTGDIKALTALAKEMLSVEAAQAEAKAHFDALNSELNDLKTVKLPEMMKELGTDIWRDPETGVAIELEPAVGTMPKDAEKRKEILAALEPLNVSEIVADEMRVLFTPGDKRAAVVRAILGLEEPTAIFEEDEEHEPLSERERGIISTMLRELNLGQLPAEESRSVHGSRFKAWLKRKIEEGHGALITDAGIWHGSYAKIKRPKK